MPPLLRFAILAFLISFAVLAWNIDEAGIAATYNDPIAHIRSQDEAVYASATIGMIKDRDWMTPKVMGRPLLLKPPLLIWLSALSLRLLGMSLFSIRLPALLFGAAGVAAVFAWVAQARSVATGVLGGILLLSPFWQLCSRQCLTDVLASALTALALVCVAFDPQLARRHTRIVFASMGAASILAKSVAGAIPFVALFLFWMVLPPQRKPKIDALAEIAVLACGVLAPWYLYQIRVHPQWLWAENIQGQLWGTGVHWDRNSVIRSLPIVYYVRRIARMDPVVLAFACVSLAGVFRILRSRQHPAALLAVCWAAVSIGALCAFQAANLSYVPAAAAVHLGRRLRTSSAGSIPRGRRLHRGRAVIDKGGGEWTPDGASTGRRRRHASILCPPSRRGPHLRRSGR